MKRSSGRSPGRPPIILEDWEVDDLCFRLRKGAGLDEAARSLGVSGRTLQRRMKVDDELRRRIDKARAARDHLGMAMAVA